MTALLSHRCEDAKEKPHIDVSRNQVEHPETDDRRHIIHDVPQDDRHDRIQYKIQQAQDRECSGLHLEIHSLSDLLICVYKHV